MSRRPRMPPWICGTSVFTRPSRISGKPVCSDTSFTGTPASRSALAEPPVDRISTPLAASACANGTRPVLSETEISARRMGTMSVMRGGIALQPQQVQRPRDAPSPRRTAPPHARGPRRPSAPRRAASAASRASAAASARCIARRHQQARHLRHHLFAPGRAHSVATTGRPVSIASITDIGSPSKWLGSTKMSAAAIRSATSSR